MSSLKDRLLSDENIYLAIYSVSSYINNRELLNSKDMEKFYKLGDKFDYSFISKTIKEVKSKIKEIIEEDKFLTAKVYFKPKRYEEKNKDNKIRNIVFRPIHSSELIEQIATIAMLNILIYKIDENKKISLSNLSRLIPNNFYGNRISTDVEVLFKPWYKQYQKYTSKANELFKKYHENQDYKWEVDLDLTNFFPSINPVSLYNFILTKLDVKMAEDDEKLIRKILEKLIFIKLQNTDINELQLYRKKANVCTKMNENNFDNKGFVIGIPQGLPHTYFLANLCMMEIQKIYKQHLPGEMLFYVDDSVIFTNNIIDFNDFNNKIKEINKDIKYWQENYFNINVDDFNNDVIEYISADKFKDYYIIEVHEAGDKSTITNVLDVKDGEVFLNNISREGSKTAFDINSMYSDEESSILYNRTKIILEMLENEIQLHNQNKIENINERKAYLKKLKRYKKFFKNRFFSLEYRIESDDSKLIDKFKENYKFLEENCDIECKLEKFFEEYSDDVFETTVSFILKKLYQTQRKDDIKWILERLKNLNEILFNFTNTNSSYFLEAYKRYFRYVERGQYYDVIDSDKYNSLSKLIRKNLVSTADKSDLAIVEFLNINFKKLSRDDLRLEFIKEILGNKLYAVFTIVINNTEQITRMIINAVFSYICQFDINDSLYLTKKNYRKITYTELRLFVYLRNKRFNLKEFLNLYKDFINKDYNIGIDYTILQVIKIFKTFIGNPKNIDNLILIHKYTCDIWKNGSKYLYFYTLHNQEHAVDLIQNILKIIKSIDYIQISANDYYILFIACYLHDISMTTMPNLDVIQSSTLKTDKIHTDFIEDIKQIGGEKGTDGDVKKILKKYYCRLDEFYENLVRSNHSKDSAKEIRSRYEFKFIDAGLREAVAEISEAHGYGVADIYKIKSEAKNKLVSSKFDKILLRLADLLDMNSYRISKTILKHNLDNMSDVSKFHWISHLITTNCNVETYYLPSDIKPKDSFLLKKSYKEIIIFRIKVQLPQFTSVKSIKCQYMNLNKCEDNSLVLSCGDECKSISCNFLCKWFAIKNKYLFMELNALKKYLESLPDNFFGVDIKVIVETEECSTIDSEQFDALKDYLEKQQYL